ncbi:MAG: hypothetical protein M3R27_13705 [Bacteroidota bacterium]|nr:hypothetical protein [Bacteroidota bacterium]
MIKLRLKYCLSGTLVLSIFALTAQTNPGNQAVVTIIGNSVSDNNNNLDNNFNNYQNNNDNNPYIQSNEPPKQQQQFVQAVSNNIEPTLENGFHLRFEMNSQPVERMNTSGYASASAGGSGGGSYGKAKKHSTTMTERSFNFKKKVKKWLPKRKKKYRPHLCGRF